MAQPLATHCHRVGLALVSGGFAFLWWRRPEPLFLSVAFFLGVGVCFCGLTSLIFRRNLRLLLAFYALLGSGLCALLLYSGPLGILVEGWITGGLFGAGLSGLFFPFVAQWAEKSRLRSALLPAAALFSLFLSPYAAPLFWLGGGMLYGQVDEWRYQSTTDFRSSRWQRDRKYRFAVLDHAATKVISPGQRADEVIRLLGEPDTKPNDQEWHYETQRPGFRFLDFSGGGLVIHFTLEGRVDRTSTNLWID